MRLPATSVARFLIRRPRRRKSRQACHRQGVPDESSLATAWSAGRGQMANHVAWVRPAYEVRGCRVGIVRLGLPESNATASYPVRRLDRLRCRGKKRWPQRSLFTNCGAFFDRTAIWQASITIPRKTPTVRTIGLSRVGSANWRGLGRDAVPDVSYRFWNEFQLFIASRLCGAGARLSPCAERKRAAPRNEDCSTDHQCLSDRHGSHQARQSTGAALS